MTINKKKELLTIYENNFKEINKLELYFNKLETWDEMNENLIKREELELENLNLKIKIKYE